MENCMEVENILSDFVKGNISADECFCMVLSLIGFDACRANFRKHVDSIQQQNPKFHNQLLNVYRAYFEIQDNQFNLPDKVDCAVENGFYANDSDHPDDKHFELDLEMAIKLSLQEGVNCRPTSSYAGVATKNIKPLTKSQQHKTEHKQSTFKPNSKNQRQNKSFKTEGEAVNETPGGNVKENNSKTRKKKKKMGPQCPLSKPPVIYWFRRDLRLYDNPALVAAASSGAPVIPVFLWSDREEEAAQVWATGGASKYWLHMALHTLNRDMIDKYNNPIVFRKSDNYLNELTEISKQTGARTLIISDLYEPHLKERDDKICKSLEAKGVPCQRFHSYLLHHPGSIRTDSLCMRGIGSVTHFMECCKQSSPEPLGFPLDPPPSLPKSDARPKSDRVEDLGLGKLPKRKDGTVVYKFL